MFRVFLDDMLINDEPIGLDDLQIQIIREDGYSNSDQILRDKTETKLSFWGDGYKYLCAKKKESLCSLVDINIEFECDGLYESIFKGVIPMSFIEFQLPPIGTANTQIRDNSFTGLIKDYTTTEIPLYSSITKNCEQLDIINETFRFNKNTDGTPNYTDVKGFDVLSLFKYLINYATDNKINVVSDFLSGTNAQNRGYAITLGYNLHNTTGNFSQIFPKVTFDSLFKELRKKLRLYMVIEYSFGVPYLRIEPEDYSFDDTTELMSFNDIPYGAKETFDINRLFNSISVGSKTTKLQDIDGETAVKDYEKSDSLLMWDDRTYNSCGYCTATKDSESVKLDLVSEYIIESNLIYEALNSVPTTSTDKYANDEAIYLFEYDTTDANKSALIVITDTKNIYNYYIRNGSVIDNYLGYTPECISLKNSTKNYFLAQRASGQAAVQTGTLYARNSDIFPSVVNIIFDNGSNLDEFLFTTPVDGNYVFNQHLTITYLYGTDSVINDTQPTYRLYFEVRDIANVLVDVYYGELFTPIDPLDPKYMEFTSPTLSLITGYTVECGIEIIQYGTVDANFDYYQIDNAEWSLPKDSTGCDVLNNNDGDSKPNIIDFSANLCYSELKTIRGNKRGYFLIRGNKYFIKSITWQPKTLPKFQLIGSESLCDCV